MTTREVVVVGGARTAIGDYGGALKDFAPTKLGAIAIKEAVSRAALIFSCTAMKRAWRSCLTDSGTGSGSAFAAAPSTGE